VFILKGVKVLCFDTLLQVLILKVDRGGHRNRREERTKATAKDNAETQRSLRCRRGTPTPGVLEKRLQAIENKGREQENEGKEAASD
jgi:hypothetical protein